MLFLPVMLSLTTIEFICKKIACSSLDVTFLPNYGSAFCYLGFNGHNISAIKQRHWYSCKWHIFHRHRKMSSQTLWGLLLANDL